MPPPRTARRSVPRVSPGTRAVLAIAAANLLWGGSTVASKTALEQVPPLTLAALRAAVALAILWPLVARSGARPATGRTPALLGLIGVAIFCGCQNLALRHASASTVALINGGIPVLTALAAVVVLRERPGGRRLFGLVVALVGVAAVVLAGIDRGGGSILGAALAFVSAASFASYAVLGRRVFPTGGALPVVAGSTRYGLLFLLPGALLELMTGRQGTPTVGDGLVVLYLGAGCSALAFVLLGYGLARLGAAHAAVFGNLKPLVGVGLAVALLGESVTAGQLGGGALAIVGVALASGRSVAAASPST